MTTTHETRGIPRARGFGRNRALDMKNQLRSRKIDPQGVTLHIPGGNCLQDVPKVLLCCALLRSIFRNTTQDSSERARCLSCDGGICSQRARVSSVRRCRTSALRLVSSVLHTPLWATRSDASILSSEGQGRGFVGSRPVAPTTLLIHHSRDGIRLDLSAPRSTRRDDLGVRPNSLATTFRIRKPEVPGPSN
jgi:hypothetical protein